MLVFKVSGLTVKSFLWHIFVKLLLPGVVGSVSVSVTEYDNAPELVVQIPGPISINTSSFVCFLARGIS